MHKAGPWLLVVLGLAVSSSVRAEVFWATLGFPKPTSVALLDPSAASPIQSSIAITGWQPAEFSLGIALRPATNGLYLVGSSGRLYLLNPVTGVATPVGPPFAPALVGTEFGIGFDNADRLRVVSNAGQNLRIDPTTGAVTVDTPLAFAPGDPNAGKTPQVSSVAYDHSHGGATAYAVDDQFGLLRLGSATASDGLLTTIAAGPGHFVGFDISPATGVAYGLDQGFSSYLSTVDLTTGATAQGPMVGGQFTFFGGLAVVAAAASIPTLSWPGLACLALGLAASAILLGRKRRSARASMPG